MAFEEDLPEFYTLGEFAETITHEGSTISAMFFNVRENLEDIYINNTYFTAPKSEVSAFIRGDLIKRNADGIEYRIKSITDHGSDLALKIIELEHIRETI